MEMCIIHTSAFAHVLSLLFMSVGGSEDEDEDEDTQKRKPAPAKKPVNPVSCHQLFFACCQQMLPVLGTSRCWFAEVSRNSR